MIRPSSWSSTQRLRRTEAPALAVRLRGPVDQLAALRSAASRVPCPHPNITRAPDRERSGAPVTAASWRLSGSGVGALAVVRALLLASATLASGLAHGSSYVDSLRESAREADVHPLRCAAATRNRRPRARAAQSRRVISTCTWRIDSITRWRRPSGATSRAGARDEGLHGALEVVAGQARAALVEVVLDLGAVGLVELVVEEEEDPAENLGAVGGRALVAARGRCVVVGSSRATLRGRRCRGSRSFSRT